MIKIIIIILIGIKAYGFIDFKTTYVSIDSVFTSIELDKYVFGINFIETIQTVYNECNKNTSFEIAHRSPNSSGIGSYTIDILYKKGAFNKDGTLKKYQVFELVENDAKILKVKSDNDILCFKIGNYSG